MITKLETLKFSDDRGSLEIIYENSNVVLKESRSEMGVLRGLHWQNKDSKQKKIIRIISNHTKICL